MCTGTVSTGPSRLAKYNEACSQKMTDSEVAAIAARLCNLTQIYSDSSRRACILASEGTLCKDAHIETDTSSSIRTNNDDANDNPFSASTSIAKITHGSATTAHATEQAMLEPTRVHLNQQLRWRKVDAINCFHREAGKDASEGKYKVEIYE
eukprot:1496897-Rhodomonas_salina.1